MSLLTSAAIALLLLLFFSVSVQALPQYLGDLNEDSNADVSDLFLLINHNDGSTPLADELLPYADINQDGAINDFDLDLLVEMILGSVPLVPIGLTTLSETSPASGEGDVSVNRETIFRFTQPLSPTTVLTPDQLNATFSGRRILARIEISSDRKTVTLFYIEPLPGSARVRVTFIGEDLRDFFGDLVDLDGDGAPGGVKILDFDTQSNTPVPGTAISGHVYASEKVPGTLNDRPIQNVLITVDGKEETLRTFTDANGFFKLDPCPAGRFFVHIDGRTAVGSQWPNGDYYPVVGKAWEAVASRANNLAAGNGVIYLPLIQAGTLQPVSATADTTITFPPAVIAANPFLAGVSVTVPANALYSDNGSRGGRVGLAPVASDRLPERLPPGMVHVIDISIQTDGAQNVDRPLPVRFPNLPDPITGIKLPPGAKSALTSYNHDTGRWEVQGPMTVTTDGNYMESDPGFGVRQPGWHTWIVGSQGSGGFFGPPGPPPGCDNPTTSCVDVGALSNGTVTPDVTDACVGGSITFRATVQDSGGIKQIVCDGFPTLVTIPSGTILYEWEIYELLTEETITGSGANATIATTHGGYYSCRFTARSQRECPPAELVLPTSGTVTVGGLNSIQAKANNLDEVSQCQNTPVSFTVQVQNVLCQDLSYQWNFAGLGTSSSQNPSFEFPEFGDYQVTVRVSCSGADCSDTQSDTVVVHRRELQGLQAALLLQNGTSINVGQPASFSASTFPPNFTDVQFDWDFGDGSNGQGAAVSHIFASAGEYAVKVTARCADGTGPTFSHIIEVVVDVPSLPPIEADIVDAPPEGSTFASGIDEKSIVLKVNDKVVLPEISAIDGGYRIYYVPNESETHSGNNTIKLEARDNAKGEGLIGEAGNGVTAEWNYPLP